jgi:adenylate cyclase
MGAGDCSGPGERVAGSGRVVARLVSNPKSLDWRFRTFTQIQRPNDIVIIALDDTSFDSKDFRDNFGRWPPRRLLYAGLVHYLNEWGAKAIGFDIFFQGADPHPGDDERFAASLSEKRNVVLGFALNKGTFQEANPETRARLKERLEQYAINVEGGKALHLVDYSGIDFPEDELLSSVTSIGCATVVSDRDGPVRRVTPLFRFRNRYYASLALALARVTAGVPADAQVRLESGPSLDFGGHRMPLDARGRMLIRWYGPAYTFKNYSIWKVFSAARRYEQLQEDTQVSPEEFKTKFQLLRGEFKKKYGLLPEEFKNKVVLIGATAVGAADFRPTAFSETHPGVEIQATVLENLLRGDSLRPARPSETVAAIVLLSFLMAGLVYSLDSALIYSLLALAAATVYFGAASWFFRAESVWVPLVAPLTGGGIAFLATTLTRYGTEGREKRKYRKTLMKYISPSLVETIMTDLDWESLRAEKKNLTVLFSDIRGFTSFSEKYPPETVIATLNEHLNLMVSVIFKYHGTLDKFVGDCVMAFWGAPLAQPNHAELAARAALEMIAGLEKLNEKWQSEGRPTLHIGVGINTGEMLFGNIGSEQRMDFTVIGDSVNLGSRLESATKELHASIVISEATYGEIQPLAEVRPLGEIHVKGKEEGIVVYELLGMAGSSAKSARMKLDEVAS